MFVVTRQVLVAGCGAGAVALSLDFKSMYRSHHRKIRVENRGRRYELFLSADNAQHILERADDPSHGFDLVDAEKMCYAAYYVSRGPGKKSNEAHDVVYGFVLFASPTEASQPKYYQLVGYTTELYGGRFILETCHLLADAYLRQWCDNHKELFNVFTPNHFLLRHGQKRKK